MTDETNGETAPNATGEADANQNDKQDPKQLDPAVLRKLAEVREKVHQTFGQIVLALSAVPRYRHQTLADLESIVLRPLMLDRVAVASTKPDGDTGLPMLAGVAIWASVSDEVDAKIREQVRAGVFPVRLKADEWTSGDTHWLLDVVAPSPEAAVSVVGNFRQVTQAERLNIHPFVVRSLPGEAAERLRGAQVGGAEAGADGDAGGPADSAD